MLHTKFCGNRSTGSGGFYHIWAWWPSCDLNYLYKLLFPIPMSLHMKFGFDWPSDLEEKVFEHCGRRPRTAMDARTWVYYKLTL